MPEQASDDPYGIEAFNRARNDQDAISALTAQYRFLFAPNQVVELRALKVRRGAGRPHTEAGFFDSDHLAEMAKTALEVSKYSKGVYFTLNPLRPDMLARRCNRIDWAAEGELSKEKDVLARRFFLVDADPVKDSHVSANEAEKAKAYVTILAVREHLNNLSWPKPILADSGNGYHLLYRVDLPAENGGFVKQMLQAMAARFDSEHVLIDQSVFNPARICKLPGTWARKGDHTPERPHRLVRILEVPGS